MLLCLQFVLSVCLISKLPATVLLIIPICASKIATQKCAGIKASSHSPMHIPGKLLIKSTMLLYLIIPYSENIIFTWFLFLKNPKQEQVLISQKYASHKRKHTYLLMEISIHHCQLDTNTFKAFHEDFYIWKQLFFLPYTHWLIAFSAL